MQPTLLFKIAMGQATAKCLMKDWWNKATTNAGSLFATKDSRPNSHSRGTTTSTAERRHFRVTFAAKCSLSPSTLENINILIQTSSLSFVALTDAQSLSASAGSYLCTDAPIRISRKKITGSWTPPLTRLLEEIITRRVVVRELMKSMIKIILKITMINIIKLEAKFQSRKSQQKTSKWKFAMKIYNGWLNLGHKSAKLIFLKLIFITLQLKRLNKFIFRRKILHHPKNVKIMII